MPGRDVLRDDPELVARCAELFSANYGTWGPQGERPGEAVRLSPDRVGKLLQGDETWLAYAELDDRLIGYCASVRFELPDRGHVAWVTQLVVDETFRNVRVATRLLYGNWQFSDFYAWGLVTANPLAVRALETATRRRCRRTIIASQGPELLAELAARIGYLPTDFTADQHGRIQPKVDTGFYLELGDMPQLRARAARGDRPWTLGDLRSGEEWFACTFASQVPESVDSHRLEALLTGSDRTWIQAYERMTLTENHRWHQYADHEVDAVLTLADVRTDAAVLDVGTGDGRHARVLASRGCAVTAVDIAEGLVRRAQLSDTSGATTYLVMDAREQLPRGPFDLAVCLYDVLGSSADREDDRQLARNLFQALRPGGVLVASVMNAALTVSRIPERNRPSGRIEFVEALEQLPGSRTMETTGNIFNPEHLLLYDGIHYRKEQFAEPGMRLPTELVVRDLRYRRHEISTLLRQAGFEDVAARPVRLGNWNEPLEETDERAKELLIVARRPANRLP